MQLKLGNLVFAPSLVGTLVTLVCIPLFIKFGFWQYHKAAQKQAIQAQYSLAETSVGIAFPWQLKADDTQAIEALKFKKVNVTGEYQPQYQVLLDNQTEQNRVGYHVITPLKITNTQTYVLVNRGWILGKDTHTELPDVTTPTGLQQVTGQVWVPSTKIFTLEDRMPKTESAAQTESTAQTDKSALPKVFQHMNMAAYAKYSGLTISPMAIKLDKASNAGGFVRNWQVPADRIATHIGYALQWFGFALATLIIYLYMSFRRGNT